MKNNVINLKQDEVTPDDLITISSFAQKYKMSKSHIYDLINRGLIKRHKWGYFKISEKEACKAVNKVG